MKQSIIITALLALALTACNKEDGDTVVAPAPADAMAPAAPADAAPADAMAPAAPADAAPADAMAPAAPADGEAAAPAAE